jgi:hypothetical protein
VAAVEVRLGAAVAASKVAPYWSAAASSALPGQSAAKAGTGHPPERKRRRSRSSTGAARRDPKP